MAADLASGLSLHTDIQFGDHLHRRWLLRDGLPSSWINDLIQTRDGYIWIGTDSGLVRYDGLRFRLFDRSNSPELPFNDIRSLHEDKDGSLWIGTRRGLARYRPGRPAQLDGIATFSGKSVRAIFEDSGGALWIGTEEDTYVRQQGASFNAVEAAPKNVRAFCEDRNRTLWLGSRFGLFRRERTAYRRVAHDRLPQSTALDKGVPQSQVNSLVCDENGDLWIAANRALLRMRNGEITALTQESLEQQFYNVLQTRDGAIIIAARFGVYLLKGESALERVADDPSALCLLEDRAGRLWIGYGDNRGLHCYWNSHIETVWADARVRCVYAGTKGGIWFGSSSGLHYLHNGMIDHLGVSDGLPDLRVQSIVPGGGDTLWIGTGKGFVKWSGERIIAAGLPPAVAGMNIGAALEDSTGTLWFALATAGGYTSKDRGDLEELPSLMQSRIHWFWEGPDGSIWIGSESGLFRSHNGRPEKITHPALDRLQNPRFLCHAETADGTLWMGTSNGIVRYRSGTFDAFPPECGLQADNVERLANDRAGNLWFGGRDGLFHLKLAELDAFAGGHADRVSSDRVEGFDRFPPLAAFSQGCLAIDELLWLVAETGLVRLPTSPFLREPPVPVARVEHVSIDGSAVNFEAPFEFLGGRRRLALGFAVQPFLNPSHLQLRYRLDEHDERWNDAGAERTASYTNLRPGKYRFRVSARRGNGEWIEANYSPTFSVKPRWWERLWMRALIGIALIGMSIWTSLAYSNAVRRRNAQLRHEIDERKRVEDDRRLAEEKAREYLHQLERINRASSMGEMATSIAHEVNQPLFAIVSNAEMAKEFLEAEQPDINEVRDSLDDIIGDGNRASSIVQQIRSLVKKEQVAKERLDLNKIVMDSLEIIRPELQMRGVSINLDLATKLPDVQGNAIELQQVVLNLIINGMQAMLEAGKASPSMLLTTAAATNNSVELSLKDRGVGLDKETADELFDPFFTTKPQGTGMGLAINRTIIEAHGGRIWATPNEDCGATFHFRLPALTESTA